MSHTENNFTVYRGDDLPIKLEFTDTDDAVIDITGWTLFFTLKKNKDDVDAKALITKTVTDLDAPTTGIQTVTITSTDTANLTGPYFYDFQFKKTDGTVNTIVDGVITFEKDVTRRTS